MTNLWWRLRRVKLANRSLWHSLLLCRRPYHHRSHWLDLLNWLARCRRRRRCGRRRCRFRLEKVLGKDTTSTVRILTLPPAVVGRCLGDDFNCVANLKVEFVPIVGLVLEGDGIVLAAWLLGTCRRCTTRRIGRCRRWRRQLRLWLKFS